MAHHIGDIVLLTDKWHEGRRPHVIVNKDDTGRFMLCPVTSRRKGLDGRFTAAIPARVGGFCKKSFIASTDGNYTKQNLRVVDQWDIIPTGASLNKSERLIAKTMIKLQQKKLRQRIAR